MIFFVVLLFFVGFGVNWMQFIVFCGVKVIIFISLVIVIIAI